MTSRRSLPLFGLLVLRLLFLLPSASLAAPDPRTADRRALLRLKSAISPDPTGLLRRWLADAASDHCTWPGITCDPVNFRVVAVNARGGGLFGVITPEIFRLDRLEELDLSGNSLHGSLPRRFPPGLRALNLSSNRLEGRIPALLAELVHLETLDLSGNHLTGHIPASAGRLANLRYLLLANNRIVGSLPTELGRLRELQVLDVSGNLLRGTVPSEIGNCLNLSVVILSSRLVVGDGVGEQSNMFEGPIPTSIASLPKLRVLQVPRAGIEGDMPSNWGGCKNLEIVDLAENMLVGEVPKYFANCRNLRFLNLSSNRLSGSIDENLPLHCISVFDVSGNQLSGSIPTNMGNTCEPLINSDEIPLAYMSDRAFRVHSALLPVDVAGYDIVYHNFGKNNLTGPLTTLPVHMSTSGSATLYAFIADGNRIKGSLDQILVEKCSNFRVLIVVLRDNEISGQFSADICRKCQSLVILDASGNHISGALPSDFGLLESLVALDFSRNHLNGQIPSSLKAIMSLNFLSLAHNNLSGLIPPGLGQLKFLKALDLSYNSLSGEIPSDLITLEYTMVLLNNNKLSGNSSDGLDATLLTIYNISSYNLPEYISGSSKVELCGAIHGNFSLQPCKVSTLPYLKRRSLDSTPGSPSQNPATGNTDSGLSTIEIASITSASAIVAVLLALVILYIYTKKCASRPSRRSSKTKEVVQFVDLGVPLTYEIVVRATGNFNASNCIGSGGFGATYKAEISPGVLVAIKRLAVGRFQGVQQFQAEVKTLGRCRHPNLVTLVGYHFSDSEMFLIYNYLPGGNLERFLQERSKRVISWRMLHKIALDVARALAYLHDSCVPHILHRDVKPSNILLDNEFNAYLSDFGLARLLGNSETHATTGVAGTFGYVAPEYAMTCRVSDKADVYSYGVVLLELLSDKKALDPSFSPYGNGFNIVTWAVTLLQRGRSREFFLEGLWEVAPHDDLVEVLHLGIKCTVDALSSRPTMKEVVQRLKELRPAAYLS